MSYQHIYNLYKDQKILLFKECYALEKIHGTSGHICWKFKDKNLHMFGGGSDHNLFLAFFDLDKLRELFINIFPMSDVTVYGEVYGGNIMGASGNYGNDVKFIGFDVKVNDMWLTVPNAEDICKRLGLEFVDYVKIPTDLDKIDSERDRPSVQAERNGIGVRRREGVVLRPPIEVVLNNGDRIMCKHKNEHYSERSTYQKIDDQDLEVLTEADDIASEWVVEQRLLHIVSKIDKKLTIRDSKEVIDTMKEDIIREAEGEIEVTKEVLKAISHKTSELFNQYLKSK